MPKKWQEMSKKQPKQPKKQPQTTRPDNSGRGRAAELEWFAAELNRKNIVHATLLVEMTGRNAVDMIENFKAYAGDRPGNLLDLTLFIRELLELLEVATRLKYNEAADLITSIIGAIGVSVGSPYHTTVYQMEKAVLQTQKIINDEQQTSK